MLNQIVLVGKVVENAKIKETATGYKFASLVIEVVKSFKNSEGNYDSDFISCTMWRGTAENVVNLCNIGSLVGIKGRLQSNVHISEEGITYYNYEVIAEKVSILTHEEPKA